MMSRKQFLRHIWTNEIDAQLEPAWIHNAISESVREPDAAFADAGCALRQLLELGADTADLCALARRVAYDAAFGVFYALGDPGVRYSESQMLHESLLGADPSGREGRPPAGGRTRDAGPTNEPNIQQVGEAPPGIPLATALELACGHVQRGTEEVRSATYASSMQLDARLREDPEASRAVRRWAPHWSVLFATQEGIVDFGYGPGPTYLDAEPVLVFDDGSVATEHENAVDG